MSNNITIRTVDKSLLNIDDFFSYCEEHWGDLQTEEVFEENLDMAEDMYTELVEKNYVSKWSGSLGGGIIRMLDSYIRVTDKNSKIAVNDGEYDNEEVLVICNTERD